ncbi:hypothetical protein [Methylobacterium tarhaniae]|uniref:hypothetical protein n=1 Tax=Methylobacterium tarhaniae TaxID=1187852 RepID=UPI003D020E5B
MRAAIMSRPRRARDIGLTIWDFREKIWVVCPSCAGPARVMDVAARERFRLVCLRCAHSAEGSTRGTPQRVGCATDGRFGLPLYLTARVRGQQLWVYNLAHLDALAEWLGANLRERPVQGLYRNRTMMSRLPPWMSSAAARPHVVRALAALRERAVSEGLS